MTAEKIWKATADSEPPTTVKTWTAPNSAGWNNGEMLLNFTATDAGSPASGVSHINVLVNGDLTVISGASGSITLSRDGTYTIEFWAVGNAGNEDGHQTRSHQIDATAPTVSCLETANPSGKNAGKSGQNADGYYIVGASDAGSGIDGGITLADNASAWSFALVNGDEIKLTQAPGVDPNAKPGAGDTEWKIQINGDVEISATDLAGNTTTVTCLVPQPPK